ncbi:hypothetical protein ACTXT7_015336 [Hymenolepis weldensis]
MESDSNDCPICLQPLLQPVEIPCGHIFCYLCLKGSAFHRRKCPLCRGDRLPSELVWYYEGRNGWWQYDERTANEIESAFSQSLSKCEVLIAGHFYIIDFVNMCQFRKDHSGRSRRIKRDSPNTSKKGVAGIRLSLLQPSLEANVDEDSGDDPANDNASDTSDFPPVSSSVNSTNHRFVPTGNSSSPNSAPSPRPNTPPAPSQPS